MNQTLDLPALCAIEFRKAVTRKIPWVRWGRLTFEGRDDYQDFSYAGEGAFPVGTTAQLQGALMGYDDDATCAARVRRIFRDPETVNYLGRVTFHELGHAVTFTLKGEALRVRLPNYGFSDVSGRSQLRVALGNEIEAFAVQHKLHHLCGFFNGEVTAEGLLRLIARRPWIGIMNPEDKLRIYRRTYDQVDQSSLNYAFEKMSEVLS